MTRNKLVFFLLLVLLLGTEVVCSANNTEVSDSEFKTVMLRLPLVIKSYKTSNFSHGNTLKDCGNLFKAMFYKERLSPQQKSKFTRTCKRYTNNVFGNQ